MLFFSDTDRQQPLIIFLKQFVISQFVTSVCFKVFMSFDKALGHQQEHLIINKKSLIYSLHFSYISSIQNVLQYI